MDLPSVKAVITRYPFLGVCANERGIDLRSCLRTILWWSVLPALVVLGSFLDSSWYLATGAVGLFRHYGFWAWVLTSPAITLLVVCALVKFISLMQTIERYSITNSVPRELEELIARHISSLSLQQRTRFVHILFVVIGLLFGVLNIRQTLDPVPIYGNIVYDSLPYWRGFILSKIYLFGLWTVIYPAAIFISLHLTWSLIVILRHMCNHEILKIDFFNRDNCGGVSAFGAINALIMAIYACIFVVIIALHETHRHTYATLLLASISMFAIFALQSFGAVYYIHKFVSLKRDQELEVVNKRLALEVRNVVVEGGHISLDLISLRTHMLSLNTYPYNKITLSIVNLIRLAPAAVALAKLLP